MARGEGYDVDGGVCVVASTLDALDRRVVGALQVDGRACWSRIAAVLGEPAAMVARRGQALLADGTVRVVGATAPAAGAVLALRCDPGRQRLAALALANRRDARFVHVLAGAYGCLAELDCDPGRLAAVVVDELPTLPGLVASAAWPVLRHVRTPAQWRPGLLTDAERDALAEFDPPPENRPLAAADPVSLPDAVLLGALARDARRSADELAAVTGLSAAAVRRRVDRLRRTGRLRLHAVVDPAVLGFGVAAVVSVRCAPRDVVAVGEALAKEPAVRLASCVAGDRQLVAEVALPDVDALHDFLTGAAWLERVVEAESSLVVGTLKRDGLFTRPADG